MGKPSQRLDVVAQGRTGPAEPHLEPADLSNPALDRARAGVDPHALLTMFEAAVYLRYHREGCAPATCRCADVCRQALQRHGVPLLRLGRRYLVRQGAVDALLEAQAQGLSLSDLRARQHVAQIRRRPVTSLTVARR